MRIDEKLEKTGFFWLPENEDFKIPGILTIKDGGEIELEVVGHFNSDLEYSNGMDNILRVIGHVEKFGLVTLDDCFYINKNLSFGGISKSKIRVNRVLSGAAWDKDEAVTFNTFSFSVDCLDEWVGISGLKVENDCEARTATIVYNPPEKISFFLDNGMRLEICFAYTLPGFPLIKEAKISQQAYFKLVSEDLLDLKEYMSVAFKITNLMCFAMDEIVAINNVTASSTEIMQSGIDGESTPVSIGVFYKSKPFADKKPHKNHHEMLFNYGAVKADAQKIINNWLAAYEYLSPALSLYFSTKTGDQKYLEGKFLALAQGLETYHRRTSSETLMEPVAFDMLVANILKGCPDDHKDWLSGRLMHGNEINLRARLKKIIEPFKTHLGSSKDIRKIIKNIVDTRNYFTHYTDALKDDSVKGRELWILCLRMEVIFNLHFLKVIGFSDEEINKVVVNSYPLKRKLGEL